MKIEAILDTQIIQNETKDGIRVNLIEDVPATVRVVETSLKQIKDEISRLILDINKKTERLNFLNSQLPQIETVVDNKIDTAIQSGAKDERVIEEQI